MSRLIFVFAFVFAGCSSAAEDLRPFVAVAGKYSLLAQAKPVPAVKTDCMNCRGTGKVGDGTVMSTCPICKGTGKVIPSSACKDGKCPTPTSR